MSAPPNQMVQLRSFRYLEPSEAAAAPPPPADSPPGEQATIRVDQKTSESSDTNNSSTRSKSTIVGGNLTSDSSDETHRPQRHSSDTNSSSNAEYQESRVDLNDESSSSSSSSSASLSSTSVSKSSEKNNLANKMANQDRRDDDDDDDNDDDATTTKATRADRETTTTRITIEAQPNEAQPQAAASRPPKAKVKLYAQQPRIAQLSGPASSPNLSNLSRGGGGATPPIRTPPVRAGAMSPGLRRVASQGQTNATANADNMSQYSFAAMGQQTARSQSHFEIRWQNVRLTAGSRSKLLPRFITENPLYRMLNPGESSTPGEHSKTPDDMVPPYSPPIQHKIPPTISEDSEMQHEQHEQQHQQHQQPSKGTIFRVSSASSDIAASGATGVVGVAPASKAAETLPAESNQPTGASRTILNNVSGAFYSGQLTAILGPSGVGKTTLLNTLTGRNTLEGTGRVSLIGGASKRMSVVTVPQVDVLPGKLTTMEDLAFTSRLKNTQANFDHQRHIDSLVKHLHMEKFLHTRIDRLSGGEERRLSIARELLNSPDIMILDEPTSGLDANTCKKIILALKDIVEHSDYILDRPMSIIVTIHQPQQEVYNLFHRVYVMAQGGRAIYEGPPNLLLPTLLEQSSLGRACQVDQLNENPAIVAIEVASGEYGQQVITELANFHECRMYEEFSSLGDELAMNSPMATPLSIRSPKKPSPLVTGAQPSPRVDLFHRRRLNSTDSSIGRPTPIMLKKNFSTGSQLDKMSVVSTCVSYASTYDAYLPEPIGRLKVDKRLRRSVVMKGDLVSHTVTLMRRSWLLATRDMFLMAIRIIGFLMVAAGTVQIFSHALDPEQHLCPKYESEVENVATFIGGIRDRMEGLLPMLRQANSTHMLFFHLLLCITMVTSALAGLVFPLQMRMFMREYKNGWYSPASFVLSQTLAELPVDMLGPLLTMLVAYPLCHQPPSAYYWREIGYIVTMIFCSIICKSQAQIVGAFLMDSVENSVFMSCVAVTFPALLSGIPVRVSQMIAPLKLASYASFLRYGFESLLSLRYGYGLCPCDPELVDGYPTSASSVAFPAQLNNMAQGFLELNGINGTLASNAELAPDGSSSANALGPAPATTILNEGENLFLRYIRMMTGASNMFVENESDLGSCDSYRSLILVGMDLDKDLLPFWLLMMLLIFVISRFLIYFVVRIVIKLRS